jgi:NAD-dependent SIR2 family protein deacetylase
MRRVRFKPSNLSFNYSLLSMIYSFKLSYLKILAGFLEQVFTSNIDNLDHQLDLPDDKIIAVHGTVTRMCCEFCQHEMPSDEFCALLRSNIKDISASDASAPAESSVIKCPNPECGKAGMKPAIVLFGANTGNEVDERQQAHLPHSRLLFVVGTALRVTPIMELPSKCLDAARVVVNINSSDKLKLPAVQGMKIPTGYDDFDFGNGRDHLMQGECDEIFAALAARLGWLPELARFRDVLPPASLQTLDKALEALA